MRGAHRPLLVATVLFSFAASSFSKDKDKVDQAERTDSVANADSKAKPSNAEIEREVLATFARHAAEDHSFGNATVEYFERFTPIEWSFAKYLAGDYNGSSPFKKDLEDIVKAVVESPRNVTFVPLSVTWTMRHTRESFPPVSLLAIEDLDSGLVHSEVVTDSSFVVAWDADGKAHHNPTIKSRCVFTQFELTDVSIKRPTVDFVFLFKLRKDGSKGEEQSTIHDATLSYEYENGKWAKISSSSHHK